LGTDIHVGRTAIRESRTGQWPCEKKDDSQGAHKTEVMRGGASHGIGLACALQ
jgi:hypothetical protein